MTFAYTKNSHSLHVHCNACKKYDVNTIECRGPYWPATCLRPTALEVLARGWGEGNTVQFQETPNFSGPSFILTSYPKN